MKSLVAAVIVGLVLFGVSASVSWFVIFPPKGEEEEAVASETESGDAEFPSSIPEDDKVKQMPVALRPEVPVTVEAVAELAQSIMKRESALIAAEKRLEQEEKRVGLLFEDLKQEREELMAFGQRIASKVAQAREAVELMKLENTNLESQKKALSALEKKTGTTSVDAETEAIVLRVDAVKSWFKNLAPEQAAGYLKEFANRGDLEFSARLLDSQDDRQIAKILAAFNDPPLVAQIIDAYTKDKVVKPAETARGRGNSIR